MLEYSESLPLAHKIGYSGGVFDGKIHYQHKCLAIRYLSCGTSKLQLHKEKTLLRSVRLGTLYNVYV
jgi:hypothetical protein